MRKTTTNAVAFSRTIFFVVCSEMDGVLYELDGRKEGPVPHGPTSSASLLQDACAVVKQFMDRDPGELRQASEICTLSNT